MRLSVRLLLAVGLLVTACGDDGAASSCAEVREPEDPISFQHVIDPDSVSFLTDPPTSGPHLSGPAVRGQLDEPVTPAAQVRALEAGTVMVQYESTDDLDGLRPLLDADDGPFAIAPADALPAPVVATAWTWKLTCESPDVDRILEFARARRGSAPGAD